jgi:protein-L-isoaspartate O-methyltransferase
MSKYIAEVETYYSARAMEYERTTGYTTPKEAALAAQMRARLQLALENSDVLQMACGPGYWTEVVALTARSILATDLDPTLISMVRQRLAGSANVRCQVADAYTLDSVSGSFNAAFANFWWSHMPKTRIREFLHVLHSKLAPGSLVMFMDDLLYYHPRPRAIDDEGNVLEERAILDGTRFQIIKNFPTKLEILSLLQGRATSIQHKEFIAEGYWTLSYRTAIV